MTDPTGFLCHLLHLDDASALSRLALSDRVGTELAYGQLAATAGAVGKDLAELEVRPGDRVAIVAPYGPNWVAALLGILSRGAVAVPLDRNLSARELAALLRDVRPAVVFVGTDEAIRVRTAAGIAAIGLPEKELPTAVTSEPEPLVVPSQPGDPAVIVYTSGATGRAKAVTISWENLASQVISLTQRQQVSSAAVFVSILPAHHTLELTAGCLTPLYAGATIHYPGSILLADVSSAIAEHRATTMIVVPAFLAALKRGIDTELAHANRIERMWVRLAALLPRGPRRLTLASFHARFGGRLRTFFVGGAALDSELAAYFHRLGFHVCQGYGMSEASPVVSMSTPWENRSGSVGKALPGTEVRIVADEILVRGPSVMLGYWEQPELTGEILDDEGWLRTGDRGFVDGDGYLFVTGRVKNLIVLPSGENVQPEEVETILGRSTLVGDVCVLGMPGPRGEQVVAVVTPSSQAYAAFSDADVRERALTQEVRRLCGEVTPYKRPSRIVVVHRDLARTASQKVSRTEVLELLSHGAPTHD